MTKNRDKLPDSASSVDAATPALRQRAENAMTESESAESALPVSPVPAKAKGASAPFSLQALHELQVHQVELEMKTPGRMLGSTWNLDADAIQPTSR